MKALGFVVAIGLAFAACGTKAASTTPPPADNRTLFERLGGQPAINAVVKEFVAVTAADERISMFFLNADKAKLEASMDVHICAITGGGCKYEGKEMLPAHTGMKVTEEAFAAFMEDLEKVLVKFNVGEREKGEVLAAFTGMKADVVGH